MSGVLLVERDRELGFLDGCFADCLHGTASVTLLGGALGAGKTAVLHALAARIEESAADTVLLTGYGNRSGQTRKLEVLAQLLAGLTLSREDREQLADLLAQGRVSAAAVDPDDELADHLPVEVAQQLTALLVQAVGNRPLVILVDDIHLVDIASRQWLLQLARQTHWAGVMIVLTNCEEAHPVSPLFHTELLRLRSYRRLVLEPISATGVERLVRTLTGVDDPERATLFHASTGGNPFLLRAAIQDHMASEEFPGVLFRQAVYACVHRSRPRVRRTAEGLAHLPEAASPALLSKLLGFSVEDVTSSLAVLGAMGLVEDQKFRHPAIRASVLDGCQERDRLQVSAARLLYREGWPMIEVAERLLAVGRVSESWQMHVLERAAEETGDRERAGACLELAYRDSGNTDHRTSIALRLVRNAWRTRPASVVGGLDRLARLPQTEWSTVMAVTAHRFWSGSPQQAASGLEDALRRGAGRDEQLSSASWVLRMWLAIVCPALPLPADAPDLGEMELNVDLTRRAVVTLDVLLRGGNPERCAAEAQDVLRAVWLDDGIGQWAATTAVTVLSQADRLDTAAASCERLLEESRHHRGRVGLFALLRADIALRQGDLSLADRRAGQAERNLPLAHWGVMSGILQGIRLAVAVETGDLARAATLAAVPVPEVLFTTRYGIPYLCARGRYHLSAERPNAALSDFLAAGRLLDRWGIRRCAAAAWRVGAAEAYLVLGDVGQANRLLEEQRALLGADDHRVRGSMLRVSGVLAPRHERIAVLRQAADAAKAGQDRLELARIMADLHDACRAAGESELAKVAALQALKLADECASAPLQQRLADHRSPAQVEGDEPAPDRLTASELRVAALAARGHTNRRIADELHVTMSTVEQHLTKVYRKLKVRHRKELVARMEQTV